MTSSFRSQTWFITGATGLVGSAVVKKLRENDLSVMALVRASSPPEMITWLQNLDVKLVIGDLMKPETYVDYLTTCDVVVHTAAAVQIRDPEINWKINHEGTKTLLHAMKTYGVRRIIHISTAGLYGPVTEGKIKETTKLDPYGSYLKSKLAAEKLFFTEFNDLLYTIIRPPFIYGEPEFDRHVIPTLVNGVPTKFIPKVIRRDPKIGFVHAEDIAKLVLLIGSTRETPSKIYNIQSFSIKLSELITQVNSSRDTSTAFIPVPYFLLYGLGFIVDIFFGLINKPFGVRKRIKFAKFDWDLSTTRAEGELGWSPLHREKKELEIYMTEYYNSDNNIEVETDIRDVLQAN